MPLPTQGGLSILSTLVEAAGLKKHFPIKSIGVFAKTQGYVRAVEDVSFTIEEGETVGIVGESGCGKSTIGRLLLHLIEPTAGEVVFQGQKLSQLDRTSLRQIRRHMQLIFQDPFASLNPRMTVGAILEEPLKIHNIGSADERKETISRLLSVVGLNEQHVSYYPHEFSGGQRQRVAIARALITRPKLVIADEPVSALDVSIQAQILNLMKELQQQFQLTYLFISHDLSVVRHVSDQVGVMYLGRLVEFAAKAAIFAQPLHPYTQALLSAVPNMNRQNKKDRIILQGDIPNPANPPSGCPFHTRCRECKDICRQELPTWKTVGAGRQVGCHLY
jgi:oligopeptide/dipeptide ABC transporter ATP-binding protein